MEKLLEHLIDFADQEFNTTPKGSNCTLSWSLAPCTVASAKNCLDNVHFRSPGQQVYNCHKMLECYIPFYMYEYTSEMVYALNKVYTNGIPKRIKITSIGSGASPDLCAIDHIIISRGQRDIDISYTGIEPNAHWFKFIDVIKSHYPSFYHAPEDILNLSQATIDRVKGTDLLVIQYFFSALYRETMSLSQCFDAIIENVVRHMAPGTHIIINDVNSYKLGRNTWDEFYSKIKMNFPTAKQQKLCFFKTNNMLDYGEEYPHFPATCGTPIRFIPSEKTFRYDPHRECRSCQMIITL